jgi:hypothetical protein
MVGVSVEVEGARTGLFPDPQGTGRYYLEAREGARYDIVLQNRTRERLGVVVTVDGLNVISGERTGGGDRMYVLDPWGSTAIRGWRVSLSDVRRFTFVDERGSYAARSGKANGRMGWIEVKVYRERSHPRPYPLIQQPEPGNPRSSAPTEDKDEARADAGSPSATPYPDQAAPEAPATGKLQDRPEAGVSKGRADAPDATAERRRAFPGTGWGARTDDPVTVVSFEPDATTAECVTLRYEYAPMLRALGIPTWPEPGRDRLGERLHGPVCASGGGHAHQGTREVRCKHDHSVRVPGSAAAVGDENVHECPGVAVESQHLVRRRSSAIVGTADVQVAVRPIGHCVDCALG